MCAVKPGHERILEFQNIYELLRNLKKRCIYWQPDKGFKWHLKEGDHEVKDEPDVDHLDVRGLGKVFRHSDEHCCQNLEVNVQIIWETSKTALKHFDKIISYNILYDLRYMKKSRSCVGKCCLCGELIEWWQGSILPASQSNWRRRWPEMIGFD